MNIQILAIIVSVVLFLVVIDLIRRGRLKERYSIVWLAASAVIFLLSIWRGLLEGISLWLGVFYPPSLLFLIAFFFLLLIVLHFSVVLSRIYNENKRLAQEIGLLRTEIKELKK